MDGFDPFSNERLAGETAKSFQHALRDDKPLRDLRLTRRAQRIQTRYGRGATVRLPAEFVPTGGSAQRGRLCLSQREAHPTWRPRRFGGARSAVTVLPGEPSADPDDGVTWRVRIDAREGALTLPQEFAAAFGAHLTQR